MKNYLYYGNTIESCSDAIIKALSERENGRFAVVIAPDSSLFAFENKVAEMGCSFDVEVMSFSSLARTVLKNKINRCLTPEGCNMIMTKAIREIADDLVYYKKSVERKGFVSEMYSTITALRNSGISPSDLENAIDSMSGYVAKKTRDLMTIYNAYLKTLTERYSDPTTRLEALLKEIPKSEFIKEREFFVVDFYSFNNKEYEVLGELLKHAYSVRIGVIDAVGGLSPKSIYPYDNTQRILKYANDSGSNVTRINSFVALDEFERFLANDLFGLGTVPKIKTDIDLELIRPSNPIEESDAVCRKIVDLVRKGARYKDIGIVMGDPNDKTLESCLSDYEIPFFKDEKNPLSDEASIKYLLFAIDACLSNLEPNKLLSLAKNPLSGISPKEVMLFENYVIKYAIKYSRFLEPFTLGEERERMIPEKVRGKIIDQIPHFKQNATMGEYVQATKDFLEKINYQDKLEAFFEKQLSYRDEIGAKRTMQIPRKLPMVLGLASEILNDYSVTLSEYLDTLQSSFDSIKLALIPVNADEVQIGLARDSKFEDLKYLFIVGASYGQIPQESGEGTILTDKYNNDLQLLNMVVRPRVKEENRFGKFELTGLLLQAEKGLYISCPKKNSKCENTRKSEIFTKFEKAFDLKEELMGKAFTTDEFVSYVTPKQRLKNLTFAISKNPTDLDEFNRSLLSLLSKEDKDKIFALYYNRDDELENGDVFMRKGEKTSVSKIEGFYVCPYAFFIKNGLGAKERESGEVKVNETGIFIHEVLEIYFAENCDRIDVIDKETAQSKALEIVEKLLQTSDRWKALVEENPRRVDGIRSEAVMITAELNELTKKSKLRPFRTEAEFGFDSADSYPAIELASGTKVSGKIDRIDTYLNNIVVIDYKTGKVKPELKEIFFGEKIQLYIYLYALKNLGYTPIGAFYQHLNARYAKKGDARYAYLGQFDITSGLDIIDPEFKTRGLSEILPIKKAEKKKKPKKKEVSAAENGGIGKEDIERINADVPTTANMCMNKEEFETLIEYSYKLLEKADAYIRAGFISPSPLKDKCEYCLTKNICNVKDNQCRSMTAKTIKDFEI